MRENRITITLSVSPDTKRMIDELKAVGITIGRVYDEWVGGLTCEACAEPFNKREAGEVVPFSCMVSAGTRRIMTEFKGMINFSRQMDRCVKARWEQAFR